MAVVECIENNKNAIPPGPEQTAVAPPRPRLITNAMSNGVVLAVNVLIGFVLTPYIISKIGKEGYGIWTLTGSLIGYFGLLKAGIGAGVMRYVSFYDAQNARDSVNKTFWTATATYVGTGLAILILSFALAGPISRFFGQGPEFQTLIRLFGSAFAIEAPATLLDSVIRSRERFLAANILVLITSIARAVALFAVLNAGWGLAGMGWVTLATSILGLAINIGLTIKICPDIAFSFSHIERGHLGRLLSFGAFATLSSLGFMLRFQSDRIIIGKYMSMEALGIYAVATTLMYYYRESIGTATRVLVPRFSYLDGQNAQAKVMDLFLLSTRAAAILATGMAVLIMAAGPAFIKLWVGNGYEATFSILILLCAAQLVDQSQTTAISFLIGSGRQGTVAGFAVAEGLLNIGLCVLLVQRFGLMGIVAGLTIPMVVIQAIVRPIYVCRLLEMKLKDYYSHCLTMPWLFAVAVVIASLLVNAERYVRTWLGLICYSAIIGAAYVTYCLVCVLTKTERLALGGLLGIKKNG